MDVNAEGSQCGSALQAASYSGHTRVAELLLVQLLLETGADVNATSGPWDIALSPASR